MCLTRLDFREVCGDLMGIYAAPTEEIGLQLVQEFAEKHAYISKGWIEN
jgi:hypothetical protein